MHLLLSLTPVVGCAGGMALCMYLMRRGHTDATPAGRDDELVRLRAEVAALRNQREDR